MICPAAIVALLVLLPSSAAAHETGAPHLDAGWTLDLSITLPLLLALSLFLVGIGRLWMRAGGGRGVTFQNVGLFMLGWLFLAAALISPLHALGERSLAAHMIEHELLMVVAAPLIVLSRPMPALLWGLPKQMRIALGALSHTAVGVLWRKLTQPSIATLLHGVAIWAWHVPKLFQAALEHEALHWLQHASFLGTAFVFWWALLKAGRERHGVAVGDLFITSVHTGLLGALMVVAPRMLYRVAENPPWQLTPLQDQQLAGLIMWVPGGTIYAAAALAFAAFWIAGSSRARIGVVYAKPAE
jgi:putative membrane protein